MTPRDGIIASFGGEADAVVADKHRCLPEMVPNAQRNAVQRPGRLTCDTQPKRSVPAGAEGAPPSGLDPRLLQVQLAVDP